MSSGGSTALSIAVKNSWYSHVQLRVDVSQPEDDLDNLNSPVEGWDQTTSGMSRNAIINPSSSTSWKFLPETTYSVECCASLREGSCNLWFKCNMTFAQQGEFDLADVLSGFQPTGRPHIPITFTNPDPTATDTRLFCYEAPSGKPVCFRREWFRAVRKGHSVTIDLPRDVPITLRMLHTEGEAWRELTRTFSVPETFDFVEDLWSSGNELPGRTGGSAPQLPDLQKHHIYLPVTKSKPPPSLRNESYLEKSDVPPVQNRVIVILRNLLSRKVIQYSYHANDTSSTASSSDSEGEGLLYSRDSVQRRFLVGR